MTLEFSLRRPKTISFPSGEISKSLMRDSRLEVGELTLLSVCQIDRPEVLVPELSFQHDQDRPARQKRKTVRAARKGYFGYAMRFSVRGCSF